MLGRANEGAIWDDWRREGICVRRAGDCRSEATGALLAARRALTATVRIILSNRRDREGQRKGNGNNELMLGVGVKLLMLSTFGQKAAWEGAVKASSNGDALHQSQRWRIDDRTTDITPPIFFHSLLARHISFQSTINWQRRWPPTFVQHLAWLRDHSRLRPLYDKVRLPHLFSAPQRPRTSIPRVRDVQRLRALRRKASDYLHQRGLMRVKGQSTRRAITSS